MDDLINEARAIGEEEMYQQPATTKATIEALCDYCEQLQRQLAEEREACAKVAEGERVVVIGPGDDAYNRACRHIAAAIRERTD